MMKDAEKRSEQFAKLDVQHGCEHSGSFCADRLRGFFEVWLVRIAASDYCLLPVFQIQCDEPLDLFTAMNEFAHVNK